MLRRTSITLLAFIILITGAEKGLAASVRDYIFVVGSSTVYPFASAVAEQFGRSTPFKTPKIEPTGTGGGMKLFCSGVNIDTPDIINASRRIQRSEYNKCRANGVKKIIEIKIGYDGIIIANSKKSPLITLSRKNIFLAMAKMVPDPRGGEELVPNPYKTWNEIDPSLPEYKITIFGPPPTSGTRDAFTSLAMEGGGQSFDFIRAMHNKNKKIYKTLCHTVREDGAYIEAGENDNLIVHKLEAMDKSFGIFGFSFLEQNADKIQGAYIDGVAPTFENIADGKYPLSRPLYIYVKKAHIGVVPGIIEYLAEFTNDRTWGRDGYLTDKGLIPSLEKERKSFAADAKALNPLILQ